MIPPTNQVAQLANAVVDKNGRTWRELALLGEGEEQYVSKTISSRIDQEAAKMATTAGIPQDDARTILIVTWMGECAGWASVQALGVQGAAALLQGGWSPFSDPQIQAATNLALGRTKVVMRATIQIPEHAENN